MLWLYCVLIVVFCCPDINANGVINADEDPIIQTIDIAKLSTRVYGTELVLVDDSFEKQKTYKLEDFFWSGSGDDGNDNDNQYDSLWGTESPPTIYKTKTIVSTIYLETMPSGSADNTSCCGPSSVTTTTEEINPTRTLTDNDDNDDDDFSDADRHFWLLTVLKSDGKDPVIIDLKNSLAKLYKTAFQRHQERHLGLATREKRQTANKPVKVYIHEVSKLNDTQEKVQVLYHVAIGGKPVDAETAAQDMTLVSDDEVQNELGYPFIIKAEPYLKSRSEPQSSTQSKNTWIFIGGTLIIALVLLLIVAFVTLGFAKCKKGTNNQSIDNKRQIFERGGVEGVGEKDNKAFVDTPTYINFREQGNQTLDIRPASSVSSSSSSQDISPLMHLKKKQRTPPKKPPRPKAALNKTIPLASVKIAPELFDSDSSTSSKRHSPENYDPGVVSPKSYLSMPSVKSFPRGPMPEPLNKVLEPVSVLHLDMPDDNEEDEDFGPHLLRYGSVGAVEDPGVIGPIVWNLHKERLEHGVSVDEGMNTLKLTRVRRRFHELLDDTFSLFGSRHQTPEQKPKLVDVKSHSAIDRVKDSEDPHKKSRPKTTDPRRVQQPPKPKGAWASTAPSPLVRPLSAPKINTDIILAEGKFKDQQDPAVPLIAAIKSEIEKCSLPGSTTDLTHY